MLVASAMSDVLIGVDYYYLRLLDAFLRFV